MMRFREIAPPEVAGQETRVIWTGREEVTLEGHHGLFSYETQCIRVRSKTGLWTVTGQKLTIDHFGADDLLIRGKIDAVSVQEEGA